MSVEEIIRQVESICKKQQVGSLYLFGSYATGTATPTSDIDFFVKDVPDMIALTDQLDQIMTLKTIDIFDYDHIHNPELRKAMDRYGKKIY